MTALNSDTTAGTLESSLFRGVADQPMAVSTPDLLTRMVKSGSGISDLVFSPGRPPQVEESGKLKPVEIPGLTKLTPDDTCRLARDLIAGNKFALQTLEEQGACDVSYSVPDLCRFRINVFSQRGSYAIVMRVIAAKVPTIKDLNLPSWLEEIATLQNGLVLVTGPTGSGKSSTLAALIHHINATRAEHIVTIEDPIEFLHWHLEGTIHQRELHSDAPTFAAALRAALRQAPKVILVGEMRDRETIDVALTAAETGHLVLSTLHTIDASKTVDRIIGAFEMGEQRQIRARLAGTFRNIISQRLVPNGFGTRVAVLEMLKSTLRTREYMVMEDVEGRTLLDAMKDGELEGMQHFDGELEKLLRAGVIDYSTALLYATNASNLQIALADFEEAAPEGLGDTRQDSGVTKGESELESLIVR